MIRGAKYLAMLAICGCATSGEVAALKQRIDDLEMRVDALGKAPKAEAGSAKFAAVPVDGAPIKGGAEAFVTIVAFEDFQCPFCARAEATMQQIEERYGANVRFAFRHQPLPFHTHAMPAAIAAECAFAQQKFWPMHDLLFQNTQALEDEDLARYAETAGLDVASWQTCFAEKNTSRIEADMKLGEKVGARGTPTFFVNGRLVMGAQPFDAFKTVIDEELAKAKASGIPARDYYRKAVLKN